MGIEDSVNFLKELYAVKVYLKKQVFIITSHFLLYHFSCIHYFDSKKFFEEVDRILAPNGILVFYTYEHSAFNVDYVPFQKMYSGAKKYWHPYYINTIEMRSL